MENNESKDLQNKRANLLEQLRTIESRLDEIEKESVLENIVGKYFVRKNANEREYFYVISMTGSGIKARLQTVGFVFHRENP